jgi:hypothetical protein
VTDSSLAEKAISVPPTRWLSSGKNIGFHFQGAQEVAGQSYLQKLFSQGGVLSSYFTHIIDTVQIGQGF